jgi:hypothetical protein
MTLLSISQTTYPRLVLNGKDTCIEYTISQAQIIGEDLAQYKVVDSANNKCQEMLNIYSAKVVYLDSIHLKDSSEIVKYKLDETSYKTIVANQDTIMGNKDVVIKQQKHEILKQKTEKGLFIFGLLVAVIYDLKLQFFH